LSFIKTNGRFNAQIQSGKFMNLKKIVFKNKVNFDCKLIYLSCAFKKSQASFNKMTIIFVKI